MDFSKLVRINDTSHNNLSNKRESIFKLEDSKETFSKESLISNPPKWVKDKKTWESAVNKATNNGEKEVPIIVALKLYKNSISTKEEDLSYDELIENRPSWAKDELKWKTVVNRATHNGEKDVPLIVPMKLYKTSESKRDLEYDKNIEEMKERRKELHMMPDSLKVSDSEDKKLSELTYWPKRVYFLYKDEETGEPVKLEGTVVGINYSDSTVNVKWDDYDDIKYNIDQEDLYELKDGVSPDYTSFNEEENTKMKTVDSALDRLQDSISSVLDNIYSNLTSDPENSDKDLFFEVYSTMNNVDYSESVTKYREILKKYEVPEDSVLWNYSDDLENAIEEYEKNSSVVDSSVVDFTKAKKLSDSECPIEVGQRVFKLFTDGLKEIAKFGHVSSVGEDKVSLDYDNGEEEEDVSLDEVYLTDSLKGLISDSALSNILNVTFDVSVSVNWLKRALAEELQAWYNYWIVYPFLKGILRTEVTDLFIETAKDELDDHAVKIINRLNELDSDTANMLDPASWKDFAGAPMLRCSGDFSIERNLAVNIVAEIAAIDTYTQICNATRGLDYKTYSLSKEILNDEQEHLQSLIEFTEDLNIDYESFIVMNPVTDSVKDLMKNSKLIDAVDILAEKSNKGTLSLYKLSKANKYLFKLSKNDNAITCYVTNGKVEKTDNILSDKLYSLTGDTGIVDNNDDSMINLFDQLFEAISDEA